MSTTQKSDDEFKISRDIIIYETDSCTESDTDSCGESESDEDGENTLGNDKKRTKRIRFANSSKYITDNVQKIAVNKSKIWYSKAEIDMIFKREVSLVRCRKSNNRSKLRKTTKDEQICLRGLERCGAVHHQNVVKTHQKYYSDKSQGRPVPNFIKMSVQKNTVSLEEKAKKLAVEDAYEALGIYESVFCQDASAGNNKSSILADACHDCIQHLREQQGCTGSMERCIV